MEAFDSAPVPFAAEYELLAKAKEYALAAYSRNTRRAYASDWRRFEDWCTARAYCSCPATPEAVALYLASLAETHRPSSLERHVSVIGRVHKANGHVSPVADAGVQRVMAGIRRSKVSRPRGKAPLTVADLDKVLCSLDDNPRGRRDQAIFLIGFAGAFRRSELVALNWEDIESQPEGIRILIRRSKTDPTGQGRVLGIPKGKTRQRCPVESLERWKECANSTRGPIFTRVFPDGRLSSLRLSDKSVARIVKQRTGRAGLDPRLYAGHSLRAGFVTEAARGGATERSIMKQTGHRALTTLWRYIREATVFQDNAVEHTGL